MDGEAIQGIIALLASQHSGSLALTEKDERSCGEFDPLSDGSANQTLLPC